VSQQTVFKRTYRVVTGLEKYFINSWLKLCFKYDSGKKNCNRCKMGL